MKTATETPPEQAEYTTPTEAPAPRLTARTGRGREVWTVTMRKGDNGAGVLGVPREVRQAIAQMQREHKQGATMALNVWLYARDRWNAGNRMPAVITQQEIVDEYGSSISTVQRAYRLLRKAGLLETETFRYRGKENDPKTAGEYLTPLPMVLSTSQAQMLNVHGSTDTASEAGATVNVSKATTPPVQSVTSSQQHVTAGGQHVTSEGLGGVNTSPVKAVFSRSSVEVSLEARSKKTVVRSITDGQVQAIDKAMEEHKVSNKLLPLLCWAYGVSSVRELTRTQANHAIKSINDDTLGVYLSDVSYRRRRVYADGLTNNDAAALRVGGWAELCNRQGQVVDIDTSNTAPLWTDEQWLKYQTPKATTEPVPPSRRITAAWLKEQMQ
jgi:hypothetical protein